MRIQLFGLALASLSTALATPLTTRADLLYPYATYRYWVNTGNFKEDPQDQLLVNKNGNLADETTGIVTFNIPSSASGHKCKLLFDLWARDVSTGSQSADVFTATKPTGASISAEGDAALKVLSKETAEVVVQSRDRHVGRIKAVIPGSAEWTMAYEGYPEFDCPAGQMVGFEFVGVGDAVAIRWDIGVTGPRVQVV
ncbi:hypothetical protein BDV25DRAFT_135617 [Aspergillus avenaceus]|uniref:Ubiquitin 3 binding protein But2 C-terminal domain-containing protein n=1 Tax=Aspergillus avenaceus TaxID=36643 RepID=A0A5N6U7W5_ASPAV|nr:hypothetical protein BDV25DRAFT_135617 [Aspergillus avenaceus]